MNLGVLLNRTPDPLEERARELLPVAQLAALGSLELKDRLTSLEKMDETWWRFFVTVAVVFMASTRLRNLALGRQREERLMKMVARPFQQWHPRADQAFEDCKAFYNRTCDGQEATHTGDEMRFVSSDTVGAWVTWNMLERAPATDEECQLVRAIGILITAAAFRAWDG